MDLKKRNRNAAAVIAALLLVSMLFTGCGGSYKESSSYNSSYAMKGDAPASEAYDEGFGLYDDDYSMNYDTAASSGKGSQTTDYDNGNSDSNRKLIKNFSLILETLEFEKSCNMVDSFVSQYHGYIEASNIRNNDYYTIYYNNYNSRSASYTIRIPNNLVDGFVSEAGNIGSITSQSENTQDITLSYLDVESRAKALEIQQERLLALLEDASSIEEIIALEDRISNVTYELESKASMLRNYDNLVSYSTVNLTLNEVKRISEPIPETMGERISSGWKETWRDIADGFQDFLVWFVVNLPYIVIWLLVLALAVVIICAIVRAFKKGSIKQYEKKQKKLLKQQEEYRKRQEAAAQAQNSAQDQNTAQAQTNPQDPAPSQKN